MSLADIPVELVERSQQNQADALNELIVLISPDIRRLIYNQVRDPEDTDEIIQEVLIRVSRHLHKIKDVNKFSAWLMRMVFNQCFTHIKKKATSARFYSFEESIEINDVQTVWATGNTYNPRQVMIRKEIRAEIDEAIVELPPRQRAAFTLFEIEDMSIRQISEVLGTSEGAVKFNIHQARKKLKKSLAHYLRKTQDQLVVDAG